MSGSDANVVERREKITYFGLDSFTREPLIGSEPLRIELEANGRATVRFSQGSVTYRDNREAIPAKHGEPAYEDIPDVETYTRATVASGHVALTDRDAIDTFVDRHGYAGVEAGHEPVVPGVDTNIIAWRLPDVLSIDGAAGATDDKGRAPTTGYALATGVKEELDWHYKQYNTHELTAAHGEEFARLANQPAGANREGVLGLYEDRRLRNDQRVDIVECVTGDEAIVAAYRGVKLSYI